MECYLGAIAACLNIAEQSPICQGASRAHTPTKQLTAAQDPNQDQIFLGHEPPLRLPPPASIEQTV